MIMKVVTVMKDGTTLEMSSLRTITVTPSDIQVMKDTDSLRRLPLGSIKGVLERLHHSNWDYMYRSLQARHEKLDHTAEFALCCLHRNGSIIDLFIKASNDRNVLIQMLCLRLIIDTLVRIGITAWTQTRTCSNAIFLRFGQTGMLQSVEGVRFSEKELRDRLIAERPNFKPLHKAYEYTSNAVHASSLEFASPFKGGYMTIVDPDDEAVDGTSFDAKVLCFDYDFISDQEIADLMSMFVVIAFDSIAECAKAIHEINRTNARIDGLVRDNTHDVYVKASNALISQMSLTGDCDGSLWSPEDGTRLG
jgi:hypothetical protein